MTAPTALEQSKDLVGNRPHHLYVFTEHTVAAGHATPFRRHDADSRSFVVISGAVDLYVYDEGGCTAITHYPRLTGWHAAPGCVYRLVNSTTEKALVVEAGSCIGSTAEATEAAALISSGAVAPGCVPASEYTVHKPWGYEVWYTKNLDNPRYALKQIHMTAGHQSSLQSHQVKSETNYVIEGEATVLNGLAAPDDPAAVIEIDRIPVTVHGPRTGWSSAPNMLHRVIARATYTSIEVSTPELDDVIRWQDDTGRGHGRIDAEHARGHAVSTSELIQRYLEEQREVMARFPVADLERAAQLLFDTYDAGGTVYGMANGGNAGTLDHFLCDFKHHPFVSEDKTRPLPPHVPRLRFVNLCGSPAELTGLVNDLGAGQMFADSLAPFVTSDDLVIAFSGGGNSVNVVRALEVARAAGAHTFAMTKGDGGCCRELADVCLVVPGTSTFPGQTDKNDNNFHFEDMVLSVNHILVGLLKDRVAGAAAAAVG
jgi:D-sedoheptulose 7-phosphate isomerase